MSRFLSLMLLAQVWHKKVKTEQEPSNNTSDSIHTRVSEPGNRPAVAHLQCVSLKWNKFSSKLNSRPRPLPAACWSPLTLQLMGKWMCPSLFTDHDRCGRKPRRGAESGVLLPAVGAGGRLSLLLLQGNPPGSYSGPNRVVLQLYYDLLTTLMWFE